MTRHDIIARNDNSFLLLPNRASLSLSVSIKSPPNAHSSSEGKVFGFTKDDKKQEEGGITR
jgi:hypothetical protein